MLKLQLVISTLLLATSVLAAPAPVPIPNTNFWWEWFTGGWHKNGNNGHHSSSSSTSTAASSDVPTLAELREYFNKFWTSFMFPNNRVEARSINSTYFTENSKGKISVTRKYGGRELNTEYIFGLFSDVYEVDFIMVGRPTQFQIAEFITQGNIVSQSVIVNHTLFPLNNYTIPVQIDFWAKVVRNSTGGLVIDEYDAVYRDFERAYGITNNASYVALKATLGATSNITGETLLKNLAIQSICKVHTSYCNGTNLQYDSYQDCVAFLENLRVGAAYEGGMNTIFCRNLHQVMLPFRPEVHCPHIGPTGGDMCRDDDHTYLDTVWDTNDYFGSSFISPGQ